MNEFFDFDQLDNDQGAQASDGRHGQHFDTVAHPEDVMAIDWASEVVPQPGPDIHLHEDSRMHESFDDFQIDARIQWPLTDTSMHSMASKEAVVGADLGFDRHVSTTESAIQHEQLFSHDTPSLLSPSSNVVDPAPPADVPTLVLPNVAAAAPIIPDTVVPSRSRLSISSRQTSTISWKPASAKRKGPQSRIPLESKQILEDEFAANPYPCSWEMDIIAHQANLEVKKVKNWFNNTRARKKVEGKFMLRYRCGQNADRGRWRVDNHKWSRRRRPIAGCEAIERQPRSTRPGLDR